MFAHGRENKPSEIVGDSPAALLFFFGRGVVLYVVTALRAEQSPTERTCGEALVGVALVDFFQPTGIQYLHMPVVLFDDTCLDQGFNSLM